MSHICCICKSHSGTHKNISFHRIPTDIELRKKWIEVIGKDVGKWSYVCSDHFDETKDFKYTRSPKAGVRKSLMKGSIPTRESNFSQSRLLTCDSCTLVNTESDQEDDPGLQVLNENCFDSIIQTESSAISETEGKKLNYNNDSLCRQRPSENEYVNDENSYELSLKEQENSTYVLVSQSTLGSPSQDENIRLHAAVSAEETNPSRKEMKPRRVRFIGDLLPTDFVKPEYHLIVSMYVKKQTTRVNRLYKQISRLEAKVNDLTSLLVDLHDQGLLTSNETDDLEISEDCT